MKFLQNTEIYETGTQCVELIKNPRLEGQPGTE